MRLPTATLTCAFPYRPLTGSSLGHCPAVVWQPPRTPPHQLRSPQSCAWLPCPRTPSSGPTCYTEPLHQYVSDGNRRHDPLDGPFARTLVSQPSTPLPTTAEGTMRQERRARCGMIKRWCLPKPDRGRPQMSGMGFFAFWRGFFRRCLASDVVPSCSAWAASSPKYWRLAGSGDMWVPAIGDPAS